MSEQPINPFLTVDKLKSNLKITNNLNDNLLEQNVNNANSMVQTTLFRYVDKTPIPVGDPIFSRCGNVSLTFALYLHALDIHDIEKSEKYLNQYNIQMFGAGSTDGEPMAGGLIQELIATKNTRTTTILARFDPRDSKIPLPTQTDLFVSQRFG